MDLPSRLGRTAARIPACPAMQTPARIAEALPWRLQGPLPCGDHQLPAHAAAALPVPRGRGRPAAGGGRGRQLPRDQLPEGARLARPDLARPGAEQPSQAPLPQLRAESVRMTRSSWSRGAQLSLRGAQVMAALGSSRQDRDQGRGKKDAEGVDEETDIFKIIRMILQRELDPVRPAAPASCCRRTRATLPHGPLQAARVAACHPCAPARTGIPRHATHRQRAADRRPGAARPSCSASARWSARSWPCA